MQQVLHYSAMQTGVAYIPLTLAVIVFANAAQALTLRFGVRLVMPVGLVLAQPSIIKRPVLELGGGKILVGFKPEQYEAIR